jgi:hypothetical protein
MLRWIRQALTPQAARWRITNFINHIGESLDPTPLLEPVRSALRTFATHAERIVQRWASSHSNARLEALNGLFQAARTRARGYRNTATYITIIYLLGAPLPDLLRVRLRMAQCEILRRSRLPMATWIMASETSIRAS